MNGYMVLTKMLFNIAENNQPKNILYHVQSMINSLALSVYNIKCIGKRTYVERFYANMLCVTGIFYNNEKKTDKSYATYNFVKAYIGGIGIFTFQFLLLNKKKVKKISK